MQVFSRLRFVLPCLLFAGLGSMLHALDGPAVYTLDLPFAVGTPTPAWLGLPDSPAGTFAALNLPIVPPEPNASLLVTVFFQEKTGGFLRISWKGAQEAEVLSDNFYEGIGMSNQRSLLVTPDTMKQGGSLGFQCGDSTLGIQRIQLQWLENQTGLTSPTIADVLVTPASGATTPEANLNGQPPLADSPAWHDRIVTVPITDAPLRIEQGVEFTVQMDSAPATARLAVTESGLPWGQHLVAWINGHRAGSISPTIPDLADGGYPSGDKAATPYVGWRDGAFFVPVSALAAGPNTLQFSPESDNPTSPVDATNPTPLAVKNVTFQFDYPVTAPTPAAAATVAPTNLSSAAAPTVEDTPPAPTPTETTETAPEPSTLPVPSPDRSDLLSLPPNTP